MSARLDAALAELAAAIRDEVAAAAPDPGAPERLLSLDEARHYLGKISRTRLYRELDSGRLRSVKVGARRLVPASALAAYTGAEQ